MAFQIGSFQSDSFQSGAGGLVLVVPRYDNTNEFFAHSVVPGTVTLTATRFDNTNAFFTHTVAPGAVTLVAPRLDNVSAFFTHAVVPGAAIVLPPLFSNANTFFVPTLAQNIEFPDWVEPGWVESGWTGWPYFNQNQFFLPAVSQSQNVAVALYINDNTFYEAYVLLNGYPPPAVVREGVIYGPGGIYTGTLRRGSGAIYLFDD